MNRGGLDDYEEHDYEDDSLPNRQNKVTTLEELVNQAPILTSRKLKSWAEIYIFLNSDPDTDPQLPNLELALKNQLYEFADKMRTQTSHPNPEWFPLIDIIYNIYILRHTLKNMPLWMASFDSFESFIVHFFQNNLTNNIKRLLIGDINSFINIYVKTRCLFEIRENQADIEVRDFYNASNRNWVVLPNTQFISQPGDLNYVDESIIDEYIQILNDKLEFERGFIHGSGSAALEGIAKEKKILSARKVLKSFADIKTGEWVTLTSIYADDQEDLQSRTLTDIYVTAGNSPYLEYTLRRWFNESPIVFHINKNRHQETLVHKGMDTETYGERKLPTIHNTGEGIIIGSEVELSDIDFIYCEKDYQPEMIKWCQVNAPHIRVVSIEAREVIHQYSEFINALAHNMKLTPAEVLEYLKQLSATRQNPN